MHGPTSITGGELIPTFSYELLNHDYLEASIDLSDADNGPCGFTYSLVSLSSGQI